MRFEPTSRCIAGRPSQEYDNDRGRSSLGTVVPPSENDDMKGLGKLRDLNPSVLVPNPRFGGEPPLEDRRGRTIEKLAYTAAEQIEGNYPVWDLQLRKQGGHTCRLQEGRHERTGGAERSRLLGCKT